MKNRVVHTCFWYFPLQLLVVSFMLTGAAWAAEPPPVSSPVFADAWDEALAFGHLTKSDVQFDDADLAQVGGTEFQIPVWLALHSKPLKLPFYVRTYRDYVFQNKDRPTELAIWSLAKVGLGIRRTLAGADPLPEEWMKSQAKDALVQAIVRLHQLAGRPLQSRQLQDLSHLTAGMDPKIAPLIAFLLLAEIHSFELRQKALQSLVKDRQLPAVFEELTSLVPMDGEDHPIVSPIIRRLIREVDVKTLMVGGIELLFAVEKVSGQLQAWAAKPPRVMGLDKLKAHRFQWTTPLGEIIVTTENKDDVYSSDKPYLLIVDGAGNDTY
ncbi:MAG: hypothetical protein C5B49_10245, partial [Bdellovibrio sp.]